MRLIASKVADLNVLSIDKCCIDLLGGHYTVLVRDHLAFGDYIV